MSINKICPICKNEFGKPYTESLKNWTVRHKFCSRFCYVESMRGRDPFLNKKRNIVSWNKGKKFPELRGENNLRWSRMDKVCIQCDKNFQVKQYRKDIAKFCSHDCEHKHRDEGKTTINERVRKGKDYAIWKVAVFMRDDYICQTCGQRGGELNADHIKPFALFPELRLAIDNGRTLCHLCHIKTETYGNRRLFVAQEA